jgi:hypothetical protein
MTTYHVYTHDRLGEEAIADGFSWPGFFIGGPWLVARRLWKTGVLVLAAEIALLGAFFAWTQGVAPSWFVASLPAFALLRGLIGLRSSDWREDSMGRRGFTFLATVQADSTEMASTRALRDAHSASAMAGQDGGSSGSRSPGAGGATMSATSPGTISEIDFERLGLASGGAEVRDRSRPPDDGASRGAWRIDRRIAFAMAALAVAAFALVVALVAARREFPRAEETAALPEDPGHAQSVALPAVVQAPAPRDLAAAPTAPARAVGTTADPAAPAIAPDPAGPSTEDARRTGAATATAGPSQENAQPPDRSPAAMERAWLQHYKAPAACTNPTDWDVYVECVNNRLRDREAFERRWSGAQATGEGTRDD